MSASWTWRLIPVAKKDRVVLGPIGAAPLWRLSCLNPHGKEWIDHIYLVREDIVNLQRTISETLNSETIDQ